MGARPPGTPSLSFSKKVINLRKTDIDKIIDLAGKGLGRRAISKQLQISEWRVRKILEENKTSDECSATERMRHQLDLAEFRKLKKQKTLFEIVGEDIIRAVQSIPPPRKPSVDKLHFRKKHEPEEMTLLWSDSQIGQFVDQKESGGLGSYSVDIFLERLEFLKTSLKKIFEIHLDNTPYPVFNIFFLGDIIEGSTIFPGQERQTDLHAAKQVILAVDQIAEFIAWVAALYPWKVKCYCVVGNHGRIGKKGEQSPLNNLDFLVYHYCREKLIHFSNVEFHISESWYMVVEKMNWRFLLVHGDDIRAWMGIPYYGLERSESRYQRMLADSQIGFHYFCCGHHHQEATIKSRIFMNGNWVGGSELSMKIMQVSNTPTQLLFSMHPLFGVTWERNIQLQNPGKPKKIKVFK